MKQEKPTCCICKKQFTGFGNNPAPVKFTGQCCNTCNEVYVIPARIALLMQNKKSK